MNAWQRRTIAARCLKFSDKQSLHNTLQGMSPGIRSSLDVPGRKASKQIKTFLDVSAPSSLLSPAGIDLLQSVQFSSVAAFTLARQTYVILFSYRGMHLFICVTYAVIPKVRFVHKNGIGVKPDPPSEGGGAGMPN